MDIVLRPLAAGELVPGVTLRADIPLGHKFAMRPVAKGAPVVKYGQVIAVATVDMARATTFTAITLLWPTAIPIRPAMQA